MNFCREGDSIFRQQDSLAFILCTLVHLYFMLPKMNFVSISM